MHVFHSSVFNHSFSVIKETVASAFNFQLENQNARVALIASIAFAALAALYVLRYFFSSKVGAETKKELDVEAPSMIQKSHQVAMQELDPSVKNEDPSASTKQSGTQKVSLAPQKKQSLRVPKNGKESRLETPSKAPLSAKDEPSESSSMDDSSWSQGEGEWEGSWPSSDNDDDAWWQDDQNESGSGKSDKSKTKSAASKEKHYLNGKEVSYRTYRCLKILEGKLDAVGKTHGKAIDNGDCFWDAYAQGLSKILKRPVTIKELRQQVSKEVKRLDQGPAEANWVKEILKGDFMDTYEQYRDTVEYTCDEILKDKHSFYPVWGKESRDGKILSQLYKVNLKVYTIGCMDEAGNMDDEENFYFGEDEIPSKLPYSETVEIALYPGHFVPVVDK